LKNATVVLVLAILVIAGFGVGYLVGDSARSTETLNPCSFITTQQEQSIAGTGAYQNVQGLDQSAPPWNYASLYQHIQQGWASLCESQAFATAVQSHDVKGVAIGGGFINTTDPDASVAGISMGWSQGASANCTQYQESWNIFIVNGTVSAPSISSGVCISNPPP
jgi:hypothetical protein